MAPALTTALGVGLLVPVALLMPTVLRVRGWPAFVAAGLTTAFSEIVVASLLVTPFDGLTTGGWLLAQALISAGVVALWIAVGKPRIPRPTLPNRATVMAQARANPVLAVLAAIVVGALSLQLVMGFVVPPNNWDSMTYHLARAAFWLQENSLAHFHNGTSWQLAYPPNGEILQAWTLSVSDGWHLVAAVQWCSLIGLIPCVYCGTRLLGFGWAPALWVAAVFALLPLPVLEATTTQNDLVVTFFLAGATVFLVRGLRDRHRGELLIGAVGLGLAIGTKGTALFMAPSLAVILIVATKTYRPPPQIIRLSALLIAGGALVFGSFSYFQNISGYGDPVGPVQSDNERDSPIYPNFVRSTWMFVETPGAHIGWLNDGLDTALTKVLGDQKTFGFSGFVADSTTSEDRSSFGYVGWLIFLPVLVYFLVAPSSPGGYRTVAAAALLYLLVFCVAKRYDEFVARLLIPMVALGIPLLGALYRRQLVVLLVSALAIAGVVPALFDNPNKRLFPNGNAKGIFELDYDAQQSVARPDFRHVLPRLDQQISPNAPVGLVGGNNSWFYPFFGPGLQRRVVILNPDEASPAQLREQGLAGAVWLNNPQAPPDSIELSPSYWFVRAARPLASN